VEASVVVGRCRGVKVKRVRGKMDVVEEVEGVDVEVEGYVERWVVWRWR